MADLNAVLESTLNIARNEVKHKASIETHFGELPKVECLPSRLSQVFLNLLVNAGQAIGADGKITLSTGVEGSEVWIRVEDTGCGISEENLTRVFDPFFTTKPVGQGTGLGLSVSYSIVSKHGGQIDVASEVGRGTQLTVRLPILHTPAEALQTLVPQTGAESRHTGDWPDSLSGDSAQGACPTATGWARTMESRS
jgi:two-component system NtrC family sensor kinase